MLSTRACSSLDECSEKGEPSLTPSLELDLYSSGNKDHIPPLHLFFSDPTTSLGDDDDTRPLDRPVRLLLPALLQRGPEHAKLLDGRVVQFRLRSERAGGQELSVGGSRDVGEHRDESVDIPEFGSEASSDDVVYRVESWSVAVVYRFSLLGV
jgi:hypothetical protein